MKQKKNKLLPSASQKNVRRYTLTQWFQGTTENASLMTPCDIVHPKNLSKCVVNPFWLIISFFF